MSKQLFRRLVAVVGLLLLPTLADAAVLTWDNDLAQTGAQDGGTATWFHNGLSWWNSDLGMNVLWDNAAGDTAVFGAAVGSNAYGVTVDATGVSAGGITFNQVYTLTGGTITLTGDSPSITVPSTTANRQPKILSTLHSTAATLTVSGYGAANYDILHLNGVNTYTSTLELVNGGFVYINAVGALSAASSGTIVRDNCTLGIVAPGAYNVADLHLAGYGTGGYTAVNPASDRGALRFGHAANTTIDWQGDLVLDADSAITQNRGTDGDITASLAGLVTISGHISGDGGFLKTGPGILKLTNANTYAGDTSIIRGALQLASTTGPAIPGDLTFVSTATIQKQRYVLLEHGDDDGMPQIASDAVVTFDPVYGNQFLRLQGHTLTVAGIVNATPASESTSRSAIENAAAETAATLVLDSDVDFSYCGLLRGNGGTLAVVKRGEGTQTLDGRAHWFTGGLTVEEGTIAYAAGSLYTSHYSPSLVVKAGATLDVSAWAGFTLSNVNTSGTAGTAGPDQILSGNGDVVGDVAVGVGGVVAPGESIGSLTVTGNLTLGGTLDVEYDSTAQTIDTLVVSGQLDLTGGTLDFSDLGTGTMTQPAYVFATYGSLVGSPAVESGVIPAGYYVDYAFGPTNTYGGKSVALVQVPEPSTLVLLAGLALALVGWRKRS